MGRMPVSPRLRARIPIRAWFADARLLLAAKTALAVGIAWIVARFVPGVADDYPYYAPLGALISMSPTLMSSARKGVQTLVSLTIGIVLAGAVIVLAEPNVVTIALVVGVGSLIAGSRWLKAGGEYVPVAALFVLIVGGQDADSYSVGYVVQMTVGIVVGLVVNLSIFPPLTVGTAAARLGALRTMLARHLDEMAEALDESWPPEHEDWAGRSDALRETSDGVRVALLDAVESRKGNPRARLNKRDLDADYSDLYDLESIAFYVRDLTEVLSAAIWKERAFDADLPESLRAPLAETFHAIAAVLDARNSDADFADAARAAEASLDKAIASLDGHHDTAHSMLGTAASVALGARRILAIMTARPEAGVAQ